MNDKLLTFEEVWQAYCKLDTSSWPDKDNFFYFFDAARQGLAGPSKLVWKTGEGASKGLHIAFVPTGVHYAVFKSFEGQYLWHSPKGHEIECQSIKDGKEQAQAHFEKLWWEISKPAIEK